MQYVRIFLIALVLCTKSSHPAYADEKEGGVEKCVALTFDDGPDRVLTPRLLTILRERGVRATFYLVGSRVVHMPTIVADIQRDDHEIGNHSWDHQNLTKVPPAALKRQIEMTDNAIAAITGAMPRTIRPPYGALDKRMLNAFPQRLFVLWDVDTLDWRYRSPSWIKKAAVSGIQNQSIILMHDIHATTITAVPEVINEMKSLGYRFATVSELYEGRCGRSKVLKNPPKGRRVSFISCL